MTLEETFVNFEQACRLERLGFPQDIDTDRAYTAHECYGVGDYSRKYNPAELVYIDNGFYQGDIVLAPTLSLVQKWLREEKNIFIDIYLIRGEHYQYGYLIYKLLDRGQTISIGQESGYDNYEYALSDSIDKAMEGLENESR